MDAGENRLRLGDCPAADGAIGALVYLLDDLEHFGFLLFIG